MDGRSVDFKNRMIDSGNKKKCLARHNEAHFLSVDLEIDSIN